MRQLRKRLTGAGIAAMLAVPMVGSAAMAEPGHELGALDRGESARLSAAQSILGQQTHGFTDRIFGADRIGTSIAASEWLYADASDPDPDAFKADAVILSRSDNYADALGGSALAAAVNAPLLLTPTGSLSSDVQAEIDRVLDGTATIYILGGTGAISNAVESGLDSLGYATTRLAGADRFETSVEIAESINTIYAGDGGLNTAFVTTGLNFPDGLAAGTTAGMYGGAVLLTSDASASASVQTFLGGLSEEVPVFAVGGQAAAAAISDFELVGADRYETAAIVADVFFGNDAVVEDDPIGIGLATGENWPDALAGGAMMAGFGPLVLTRTNTLPDVTADTVRHLVTQTDGTTPADVDFGAVFGGEAVVGTSPFNAFAGLIAGQ